MASGVHILWRNESDFQETRRMPFLKMIIKELHLYYVKPCFLAVYIRFTDLNNFCG